MKYSHLLFDADDTLFDFPKASSRAFSIMCEAHGISNSPEIYQLYHEINLELWAAFDQGEVTKEFVTLERYVRFFKALDIDEDPAQCNRDYLAALGQVVYPLPHAEAVCRTLAERGHRLYIVTNAVASVQRSRLRNCAFGDLRPRHHVGKHAGHRRLPCHRHPGRKQRRVSLLLVQSRRKAPPGGPAHRLRGHRPAGAVGYRIIAAESPIMAAVRGLSQRMCAVTDLKSGFTTFQVI